MGKQIELGLGKYSCRRRALVAELHDDRLLGMDTEPTAPTAGWLPNSALNSCCS